MSLVKSLNFPFHPGSATSCFVGAGAFPAYMAPVKECENLEAKGALHLPHLKCMQNGTLVVRNVTLTFYKHCSHGSKRDNTKTR